MTALITLTSISVYLCGFVFTARNHARFLLERNDHPDTYRTDRVSRSAAAGFGFGWGLFWPLYWIFCRSILSGKNGALNYRTTEQRLADAKRQQIRDQAEILRLEKVVSDYQNPKESS